MHENSDFLRLVVNSIRKDLDTNNEVDNCLALHAIANVGGSEMAEALVEDVHRLLISPWVNIDSVSLTVDHQYSGRLKPLSRKKLLLPFCDYIANTPRYCQQRSGLFALCL
jgi:hypothetical protein